MWVCLEGGGPFVAMCCCLCFTGSSGEVPCCRHSSAVVTDGSAGLSVGDAVVMCRGKVVLQQVLAAGKQVPIKE